MARTLAVNRLVEIHSIVTSRFATTASIGGVPQRLGPPQVPLKIVFLDAVPPTLLNNPKESPSAVRPPLTRHRNEKMPGSLNVLAAYAFGGRRTSVCDSKTSSLKMWNARPQSHTVLNSHRQPYPSRHTTSMFKRLTARCLYTHKLYVDH